MRRLVIVTVIIMMILGGCAEEKGAQVSSPSVNIELQHTFEPPTIEDIEITISATGDVTMGNYVGQGYERTFNQMFDQEGYDYFLKNVRDYFAADDMTIVNLEGTLTTSEDLAPGRTFNIKGDPSYTNILHEGEVEVVGMDNNHRRDFGEQGVKDTVNALETAEIPYAYGENLGFYEVKGVKIGWVSVNALSGGESVASTLENGIKKLREECDIVLACCHWGIERDYYPTGYQRDLGKNCIDWGADLVIGHHPHVLQGMEEYKGKIILYSLGNFCFGANKNPADKDSMIYQQTFKFQKVTTWDGNVTVNRLDNFDAKMIPCSISSVTYRNDYCPTPLEGSEGQRVIDRMNTFSKDFGVHVNEEGVVEWTTENAND